MEPKFLAATCKFKTPKAFPYTKGYKLEPLLRTSRTSQLFPYRGIISKSSTWEWAEGNPRLWEDNRAPTHPSWTDHMLRAPSRHLQQQSHLLHHPERILQHHCSAAISQGKAWVVFSSNFATSWEIPPQNSPSPTVNDCGLAQHTDHSWLHQNRFPLGVSWEAPPSSQ